MKKERKGCIGTLPFFEEIIGNDYLERIRLEIERALTGFLEGFAALEEAEDPPDGLKHSQDQVE